MHPQQVPPPKQRTRLVIQLVALSLMAALALAGFVALSTVQGAPSQQAATSTPTPSPTPAFATSGPVSSGLSLRTYGFLNQGAGDYNVISRTLISPSAPVIQGPKTDGIDQVPGVALGYVEDKPYTDPEAPFYPQHAQAPRHDSITWNPVIMSEVFTLDENQRAGLYRRLFASGSGINTAEKVWRRHWYEPQHLDKDQDGNSVISASDVVYPAIMQEYTYGLISNQSLRPDGRPGPLPIWARPGGGTFIFPIGQRMSELTDANNNFTSGGPGAQRGLGLTSFDAEGDGSPDITHIESELTLWDALARDVALDFNGNRVLDPLDFDTTPLNGNELLILRLDPKMIDNDPNTPQKNYIQFLDHVAVLRNNLTNPNGAQFDIYWTGSFMPRFLGTITLGRGDAALANVNGAPQIIRAFNGSVANSGGNLCVYPGGPWFIYLESSDAADNSATIIVGRALGATHTSMEAGPFDANDFSLEPWWLKRMYVDGHEYNTVAINTRGSGVALPSPVLNGCAPDPLTAVVTDNSEFTYLTVREPVCKGPDVTIFQHSVILACYLPGERLPSLPPYNYEHYVMADVQSITQFTTSESQVKYLGPLVGPVSPILQDDGPFPYTGAWPGVPVGPYNDPAANSFFYVQEDREPQFLGELSERYAQFVDSTSPTGDREFWYTQHFWTLPDEFTAYILPNIPETTPPLPANIPNVNPDLYLLTSSFIAPEGEYRRWVYNTPAPEDRIRDRAKFWFDPDGQGAGLNKIYKDANGIRIYGRDNEGAGNRAIITNTLGHPIEVPFYTDYLSIFDPRGTQAPVKDSLTLNPAYLAEFRSGNEPLAAYYGLIAADGIDAREKVFPRIWYEPNYLDKILRVRARVDLGAENEPNNTCSQANSFDGTLNPLAFFTGDATADPDFFRFSLTESRDVVILGAVGTTVTVFGGCSGTTASGPRQDTDPLAETFRGHLLPGTYWVQVTGGAYTITFDLGAGEEEEYRFPALQQEYTYMFLDFADQPTTTGPGGRMFFPTATDRQNLPLPPANAGLGWSPASPSHGAGLTTFDTNFDGIPEVVNIEHETSLRNLTNISADFNGNGVLDLFDPGIGPTPLSGDEMVIFRTEGLDLIRGASAQFLDYMVRLVNVDYISGRADLQIWFTGGGLHPVTNTNGDSCPDYSKHPDFIRTITLNLGEMAIVDRNSVRRIPAGGGNLNSFDGAWFMYVQGVSAPIPGQPQSERVSVVLGRALGAAGAAIDDGNGGHSFAPGLPWYMKRFFVDGHEYNVTAVLTPPNVGGQGRFKAITIRTPAPKPCDFVNYEDSIVLQGYFQPAQFQFGVDTNLKSVAPPFNMDHSILEDIRPRTPAQFATTTGFQTLCTGDVIGNVGPLVIRINQETVEPRFFGELKEMQDYDPIDPFAVGKPTWATEQFNTQPDHYTDLGLPTGQYYLLTSSWETKIGRLSYKSCNTIIDTMDELSAVHPPLNLLNPFPLDPVPLSTGTWPGGLPYFQATLDYLEPPFVDSSFFDLDPLNDQTNPELFDDIRNTIRVQFWYNPNDGGPGPVQAGTDVGDIYVNRWTASAGGGGNPTATPTPTRTPTPTNTTQPGVPTNTPTPTATGIVGGGNGVCPPPGSAIVPLAQGAQPSIHVWPINPNITVGQQLTMCVYLQNIDNLYGLDVQLGFNGQILGVQDADPNRPGVNVTIRELPFAPGLFSNPESDVASNVINYAISLVNPAPAQSGSGAVFAFVVQGTQQGQSLVQFNSVQIARNIGGNLFFSNLANTNNSLVTVTGSANMGSVQGRVVAQGRTQHHDVSMAMGNAATVSDLDGIYTLTTLNGLYNILGTKSKYLPSQMPNVAVQANGFVALPMMALRGGDANNDGSINLFDLVIVAANYDSSPPSNQQADINDDGRVDVVDLVLVGSNYGFNGVQQGFVTKAMLAEAKGLKDVEGIHKSAAPIARLSIDAPKAVKKGEEFKVAVHVRNAHNLFGAQVGVSFDPSLVELVDADKALDGRQGVLGELLPTAYVATNKADATKPGVFRFAATLLTPDKAVDGEGTLVYLTFRALDDGAPQIKLSDARLADDEATALPSVIAGIK